MCKERGKHLLVTLNLQHFIGYSTVESEIR